MLTGLAAPRPARQRRHELEVEPPVERRVRRGQVVPQPSRRRRPGPFRREGVGQQGIAQLGPHRAVPGGRQEAPQSIREQLRAQRRALVPDGGHVPPSGRVTPARNPRLCRGGFG